MVLAHLLTQLELMLMRPSKSSVFAVAAGCSWEVLSVLLVGVMPAPLLAGRFSDPFEVLLLLSHRLQLLDSREKAPVDPDGCSVLAAGWLAASLQQV
jgi:hypothetical protein